VTEAEWAAGNQGCFSYGDGINTFRFPLAKDFIRAKESGRTVGSYQADEIKSHTHSVYRTASTTDGEYAYNGNFRTILSGDRGGVYATYNGGSIQFLGSTGDTETRPKNIMQQYFMKI
jgi:hypothetical protein